MIKTILTVSIAVGMFYFVKFLIRLDRAEQAEWDLYKVQHHCVLSGTIDGQISQTTGIGIGANGQAVPAIGITTTPSQDIYTCDDNKIIIR